MSLITGLSIVRFLFFYSPLSLLSCFSPCFSLCFHPPPPPPSFMPVSSSPSRCLVRAAATYLFPLSMCAFLLVILLIITFPAFLICVRRVYSVSFQNCFVSSSLSFCFGLLCSRTRYVGVSLALPILLRFRLFGVFSLAVCDHIICISLLRGAIVNRTYGIHKTYIFNHFYQEYLVLLTMIRRNRTRNQNGHYQYAY